jgi:hypothetical protein
LGRFGRCKSNLIAALWHVCCRHFTQDMLVELNVSTPESGGSLRLRMRSCVVAVLAEGWAFTAHRDSREVSQGMQRRPVSCGSRFCSFGSTLFDILLRSFFASSLFHLVCCGMLWPLSGGLASLEKLQATLDSLAAEAPTNKAKKDSSMPALHTWTHAHTSCTSCHMCAAYFNLKVCLIDTPQL